MLESFVADFLSEGRDSQGRLLGLDLRSSIGLLRLTNTIKAWLAGRKTARLRASEAAKERANGRGGRNGDSGRAKNETAKRTRGEQRGEISEKAWSDNGGMATW